MSESEPTVQAGTSSPRVSTAKTAARNPSANVSARHLSKLSFAALVGCPVFAGVGLVIYVLPVLLFILAGGGNLQTFGNFANAFTVPAVCALVLGFACLLLAAIGYFVVNFRRN